MVSVYYKKAQLISKKKTALTNVCYKTVCSLAEDSLINKHHLAKLKYTKCFHLRTLAILPNFFLANIFSKFASHPLYIRMCKYALIKQCSILINTT